jgi:hypothetical protein
MSKDLFKNNSKFLLQLSLTTGLMGILLASNLLVNSKQLANIPGLPVDAYQTMDVINEYVDSHNPSTPYIFLVEDNSSFAESNSDLWQRIIKARISNKGLASSYLYFGTLDYLLRGEQTALHQNELTPLSYEDRFSNSSQRWFDLLVKDHVLRNQAMTIFIIQDYNPDIFAKYEFLPMVDEIGPGILVVNVPEDLTGQNALIQKTP